jgi:hypothetical protein
MTGKYNSSLKKKKLSLFFIYFCIEGSANVLLLHLEDDKILFYPVNMGYTSILLW